MKLSLNRDRKQAESRRWNAVAFSLSMLVLAMVWLPKTDNNDGLIGCEKH